MKKNTTKTNIIEKLETLESNINNVIGLLTTVENSLFFASERNDKDMTKPAAAAIDVITTMMGSYVECLEDIRYALKDTNSSEM